MDTRRSFYLYYARTLIASRIITRAECGWRMHGIYLRESLTASSPA